MATVDVKGKVYDEARHVIGRETKRSPAPRY